MNEFSSFRCLEIGVGQKSLLDSPKLVSIDEKISNYLGIDFSSVAIERLRQLSKRTYQVIDFCEYSSDDRFNLIIDAHCMHTIVDEHLKIKFLKNVFEHLESEGFFFLESMILPSLPNDLIEYRYEGDGKYYKDDRIVLSLFKARELEDILLSIGFQIVYLSCPIGLKFVAESFRDYPLLGDPDVMRVILRKV